jgi:hypothetical protein
MCGDTEDDTGTVYLYEASDIAALAGVTQVTGQLLIYEDLDVTDLSGLESLRCVGSLEIAPTKLTSLSGLDALTHVEGGLSIVDSAITDLSGMPNLQHVGGTLRIYNNNSIVDMSGLPEGLEFESLKVEGNDELLSLNGMQNHTSLLATVVEIRNNGKLASLDGLQNVSTIESPNGGDMTFTISGNAVLTDTSALESVTSFKGSLEVVSNTLLKRLDLDLVSAPELRINANGDFEDLGGLVTLEELQSLQIRSESLVTLDGLDSLKSVGGLSIRGSNVSDASGLAAVETVSGELDLRLGQVTSLNGLSSLTSVGTLSIYDCDALTDLSGMASLTSFGSLRVGDNDELLSLTGLPAGQTALSGELRFTDNPKLADLSVLSSVETTSADIFFQNNASLTDLSGLSSLQSANRFQILFSPALTSLSGLGSLTNVTADLYVYECGGLTDLSGLDELDHAGKFTIQNNGNLTSLDGVETLKTTIDVRVLGNAKLANVSSGLAGLTDATGNFTIVSNPVLPVCDAALAASGVTVGGTVSTSAGNDAGGVCP